MAHPEAASAAALPASLPDRDAIAAAAIRLAPWIRRTPALAVDPADLGLTGRRAPVVLKLESLQHAGSFKARGAHLQMLADDLPAAGVVAASGGNYGVAAAYAARRLGVAATVFVPDVTAPAKLAALRAQGAAVEVVPGFYADALAASRERAAATGARLLHAYDQYEMVAGAGTAARELAEQAALDRVVTAVGGGGLIGGMACWFRDDVAVWGAETRGCRALDAALEAGRPVEVEISGIGADALGARQVGDLPFAAAQRWVDRVVVVDDEDLRDAQRRLWSAVRIAVEPAGAAALASLVVMPAGDPDERVGVVVSGANVDPATLV
jgi:threonine dehydratase